MSFLFSCYSTYSQDNKLTEAGGKEIPITDLNKRQNGTLGFVCDPDFLLLGWTGIRRLVSKNSGQFSSSSSAITNHGANLKFVHNAEQCDLARKLTVQKEENIKSWVPFVLTKYGEFSLNGVDLHESWVSFPAENGGLRAGKLLERFAVFPRRFHHNPF